MNKEDKQVLEGIHKEAGFLDIIFGASKDATKEGAKWAYDKATTAMFIGVPAVTAVAGVLAAKATSPVSVSKNTDNLLYLNALETEVESAKKRIESLKAQKEAKRQKKQKYDKFISN